MRRGYFWGLVIVLMLAAVGAVVADVLVRPKYESVALVRIRAALTQPAGEDGQRGKEVDAEKCLQSQVELARSRRVIDQARQQSVWTDLMRETGDEAVASFARNVRIEHPDRSEIIRITFTDKTPDGAAAGATAMVEALTAILEERTEEAKRLQFFERGRDALQTELRSVNQRIEVLSKSYGADDLSSILEFKLHEENKVESELKRIQLAMQQRQHSEQLAAQEKELKALLEKLRKMNAGWRERERELARLGSEREAIRRRLNEVTQKLELAPVITNRIQVMSNGVKPMRPVTERYRVVAGGAGAGLGVGLVVLICLRMLRGRRGK